MEVEPYFQGVFAGVLVNSLFPALKQAGKAKPLDAVMGLVMKSMVRDEDSPEVKGVVKVIELWI